MGYDKDLVTCISSTADGLPSGQMAVAVHAFAVDAAAAVPDDGGDLLIKSGTQVDLRLLCFIQVIDLTGQAHDAQHRGGQRIGDPLQAVAAPHDRPDLRLSGQDQVMQIGRDDRDLRALMRVGEGSHGGHFHHGWLQTMAAGGAVLDHQPGDLFAHAAEELLGCLHILTQPLAKGFRTIAADADGPVIIHFDIIDPAFLHPTDDVLIQIRYDFRIAEIQIGLATFHQRIAVSFQHPFRFFTDVGLAADVLPLEPQSGPHTGRMDPVGHTLQTIGEQFRTYVPVTTVLEPERIALTEPARIDDQTIKALALQFLDDGRKVFL